MVTYFLEIFLLFSHFEKVEYKSVWLAPLVKAPGRIGGIDWAIFFSTEVLIIKCGNYTDLFSSMNHLFHSLRNNKKWVFVTVLAEKKTKSTGENILLCQDVQLSRTVENLPFSLIWSLVKPANGLYCKYYFNSLFEMNVSL